MLTKEQEQLLAFERKWYRCAGVKESAIRSEFGISATRYFQLLNGLIDDPEAMRAEPQLVARLRRLRAKRQLARHPHRTVLRD